MIAEGLETPPNNIGPRSTPNYRALAAAGVHDLPGGGKVFAGQRDDAFFGDIGAIFDLVAIRNGTGATGGGRDFFAGYGVHSIALQLPIAAARHLEPRHRRLDDDRAAAGVGAGVEAGAAPVDALGAGLAPRQPADQRGDHPDAA